jgi:hypothetical protein
LKDFFSEESEEGSVDSGEDVNPYGEVTLHPRRLPPKKGATMATTTEQGDGGIRQRL